MTTTFLLLIRHGENDWVDSGRLAGRTPDVYLNKKGRQQAAALALQLAEQPIRAVYSSPLERCIETATPTAQALKLPILVEESLIEGDFGDWQGEMLKELTNLPAWKRVQQNPSSFIFPNGESFCDMQHRAVTAIERLQHRHPDEAIAIFSHADIIRVAMAHYLGIALDLFQRIVISTASISAIGFYNHSPAILFMNRGAHLPSLEIKNEETEGTEQSPD